MAEKNSPLPAELELEIKKLKASARVQRSLSGEVKSKALIALGDALEFKSLDIQIANSVDLANLPQSTTPAFRDRLTLTPERISAMATSLRAVATLPDPNNEVVEDRTLANGLHVQRVRAPLGCLFMIFESRPNVILEAFSLAFKSGNVILLRGGSDSRGTAQVIYDLMTQSLKASGLGHVPFLGLEDYDRGLVEILLSRTDLIDVVVPRGGDRLIQFVTATAQMPIIKNDRGLCHTYVDDEADLDMAVRIVQNAKVQRPGVCNSLETVLVHEAVVDRFLPLLADATVSARLQWRTDDRAFATLRGRVPSELLQRAEPIDWDTEHLDLIINCRVVKSLDEALAHIERHGSKHSEAIVTANAEKAQKFQTEVDAAAVYWNASTRFTDGFELGLGGELGISTQKLHVRGPVGLRELTTPRWIIRGTGQTRS